MSSPFVQAKIQPSTEFIWTYPRGEVDKKRPYLQGYDGVVVDVVDNLLFTPEPDLNITLDDSWASAQSREVYPMSSFSACVLDVLTSETDLWSVDLANIVANTRMRSLSPLTSLLFPPFPPFSSIGDFWITQSRLEMGVQFLYPFDMDSMYVITSNKEEPPSLWTILSKPWQPFTFELWLYNLAFILLVSATVTTVTDYGNDPDFVNDRWVARWLKGAYMNSIAFVSRSIKNNPRSVPARLAAFGYGFFLLVISSPSVPVSHELSTITRTHPRTPNTGYSAVLHSSPGVPSGCQKRQLRNP